MNATVLDDVARLERIREKQLVKNPSNSILGRVRVRRVIARSLRSNPLQLLWLDRRKRLLNVGCGGNVLGDFVNVDYGWVRGQDLCWDITKRIPLPRHSMRGVFVEHALEHFTWDCVCNTLLPEFLRVLSPGGTIRISVPDAEKAVELYVEAKRQGLVDRPFRDASGRAVTPMMLLNNTFRQIYVPLAAGHEFAFDFQTLEFFLHRAGFVSVRREEYMSGRDDALLVDYKRRAEESLYVEASTPT
jgi:predicted SAM-dependent methyltransferase